MSSPTFTRPSRGDVLELTIDSLAHGGNGVARLEGYVVFVAGGLPGDRVRAVVGKSKKAYAEARAIEILEPSPDRIPEVADHPGAPWQVLPYERQLAVKAEQVEDALRRIGRLDDFELEPIVPAEQQWRYRNKVEFSFGTRPGRRARLRLPRARPLERHRRRWTTACSSPSASTSCAAQALAFCKGYMPWDRRDQRGFLRNLVIREGRRTGQIQVRLVTSPGKLDVDGFIDAVDADGLWWTQTADLGESTYGGEHDAALRRARSSSTSSTAWTS